MVAQAGCQHAQGTLDRAEQRRGDALDQVAVAVEEERVVGLRRDRVATHQADHVGDLAQHRQPLAVAGQVGQ